MHLFDMATVFIVLTLVGVEVTALCSSIPPLAGLTPNRSRKYSVAYPSCLEG